ncbi:cryptochrome/photolyase family protein [Roseibium aestuarii]|uniref:Cryptochrome/photolyase family protein n=1 Tax=Roseibium aestuarii TaxID=2600299 RepID=A0ABW4K3L4_9HYPH|nr:cryptochrome/photolyase family protein [Roseibium aestuarii]
MPVRRLLPVLADQLTRQLPSLRGGRKDSDRILMMEVSEETTYVPHHRKKIAFLLSAMRHFAAELRADGWQVDYVTLDDPQNTGSFSGEVKRACDRLEPEEVHVTFPGEWRVLQAMRAWEVEAGCPVVIIEDDRFLCSRAEFADWAEGRKQLRMEYFYRDMRRRTGLLMEGDEPAGGRWNFDAENRKAADPDLFMPRPSRFEPDAVTRDVLDMVADRFPGGFGDLEPFWFAVTRDQAETAFEAFLDKALPSFGDYQDAMLQGQPFLYHAVVSPYLNAGLLDPLEMCRKAEAAYRSGHAPLNAVEGFIRQIIGWREYVRGIYWLKMPEYRERNALGANRNLPDFYWSGETDMACVAAAVRQTRREAYAHHIQRLMVTGNFALLAGVDPHQVHEWYLAVYADAFEWVELPNTLGMSQFADGGLLGSKPYAAGGNYIHRQSDYCTGCAYSVKRKTGEGACPFTPLYWHFLDRHRERLKGNMRLSQIYRTWDRMDAATREAYLETAQAYLDRIDAGRRV